MNHRLLMVALLVASAGPLVACGDDEDGAGAAAPPAAQTAAPAAAGMPAELAGTWKAELKRSELESPPDDLTEASSDWELTLLETGGKEDGPSMTVSNDEIGEIVNPITFADERISLEIPVDCRVYSYAIEGEQLTLTSTESGCPADSISSVLTARPWQRTQ